MPQVPKDPPARWMSLIVALIVIVATYLYHVEWWNQFS